MKKKNGRGGRGRENSGDRSVGLMREVYERVDM